MSTTPSKQTTIEDVAKRSGVSVATVSRALRDLPNVAPSTRERIRAVAKELAYVADPSAARLAAGRTGTIAVAVPVVNTWYFSNVVAGLEAVLKEANYDLLLYVVASESERHRFLAGRGAWWRRSDALVLVDILLFPDEAERLSEADAQIVTVGLATEHFGSVTLHESKAAQLAVRHLLRGGHKRIGLLHGLPHELGFQIPGLRRDGYRKALTEAGIPIDSELEVIGDFSVEGGREAIGRLLELEDPPTAVFAMSDEMALGALDELRQRSIRCPEDMAVIGFDDNEMSALLGLTTIRQDVEAVGAAAGRLLLKSIRDHNTPTEQVVAPTCLVVRTTSN